MTKKVRFVDATMDERRALASWLRERISEIEPEERSVNGELGKRFLATLRGLEEHIRPKDGGDNG